MIFAILLKKPALDSDQFCTEILNEKDKTKLEKSNKPKNFLQQIQKLRIPPLSSGRIAADRSARERRERIEKSLKEILFYTLFILVAFLTIYSMKDERRFMQNNAVRNIFASDDERVDLKVNFHKVYLLRIPS